MTNHLDVACGSLCSISSNVVDYLASKTDNQTSATAYYYCDFSEKQTLETVSILGTLIKQLMLPKTSLLETTGAQILRTYSDGIRSPSREELIDLLCSILAAYSLVYVMLDGLDECERDVQQDILLALNRLAHFGQTTVKVFISSREDAQIANALRGYPFVQMSEAKLRDDIVQFVEETVKSKLYSGELLIRDPALEQEIISTLVTRSQGMYVSRTMLHHCR